MRIGIEAERANHPNPTGVEHYAKQLILAIADLDTQNDYILYLRSEPEMWIKNLPKNFSYKVMPFPIFWTQLRISWEMIFHPVDALFIMASALPLIHPKNSVVTIHDLAWLYYPETFSRFMRFYLPTSTWYAVKSAHKIIAVSEQTKKDLIKHYKIRRDKVQVVYHGFDLSKENREEETEEKVRIAKLPEKFVVFVSTLQPRKNILGLIDAFVELKKEKRIEHSLVIVGGRGWLDTYDKVIAESTKHPEIIYFGYARDRLAIIKKADLLVQPAFYEGFGMTILDAFATGVPVVCSNISSLPEVGGDAAEYFDPKSKEDMKKAIYKVITDRRFHDELAHKGIERLKEFSWKKCAEQTLNVLEVRDV